MRAYKTVLLAILILTPAKPAYAAPVAFSGDRPAGRVEEYYFPVIKSKEEILAAIPGGVFPEDKVSFFPDPSLRIGSKVEIERANVIYVVEGKRKRKYRSFAADVNSFLAEKEIELGEKDKISPELSAAVGDGSEIVITRVKETNVEVRKTIPLETVEKEDSTLEKGKKEVLEKGEAGERKLTYLIRREDGEEVFRKLVSDVVTKPMKKRVIKKGTKLPYISSGVATWYGGVPAKTAAHKKLPRGTMVKVTNLSNGKSVIVKINDYGPVGAEIDLSKDAFEAIAPIGAGRANVKLEKWIDD